MEELLRVRASHIPKKFQEQCTTLLGLFGVILRIDEKKILIPSQMPKGPPEILVTPPSHLLKAEQGTGLQYRSLSRYWFMDFLPEGFWPRLICRLVVDQVLRSQLEKIAPKQAASAAMGQVSSISPWEAWRKGLVWVVSGRPILEVREVPNTRDALVLADGSLKEVLPGDYRLELHCHLHHCEAVRGLHLQDEEESESVVVIRVPHPPSLHAPHSPCPTPLHVHPFLDPPLPTLPHPLLGKPLLSEATHILVMVMQHLEALVRDWFPGVFIGPALLPERSSIPSFAPCWKCLHPSSTPPTTTKIFGVTSVVAVGLKAVGLKAVFCFPMGKCVDAISQHKDDVECPFHGKLPIDCVMPDLVSCYTHVTCSLLTFACCMLLVLSPLWCVCTPCGVCVPIVVCVYPLWCVCTPCGVCVPLVV